MSVVGFDLGNESSIVVVAHRRIIDTVQVLPWIYFLVHLLLLTFSSSNICIYIYIYIYIYIL